MRALATAERINLFPANASNDDEIFGYLWWPQPRIGPYGHLYQPPSIYR